MKRLVIFIIVLCSIALVFSQPTQLESQPLFQATASLWTQIGPLGGEIMGMAFNPIDNNEIYAVVYSDPGQVFRSSNAGRTWQRIALLKSKFYFEEGYLYDIAVDPLNPNTIYVVGKYGLFKSTNHGSSWNEYRVGFNRSWKESSICSEGKIAINPKNPNTIYVSGNYTYYASGWKHSMAVFKSTNGGQSWTFKKLATASNSANTNLLAINGSNPDVIYAGGDCWDESGITYKIFRSSDGGSSWKNIKNSPNDEIYALASDPINPSKVYFGTLWGIYRSSDGGQTWLKNNGDVCTNALAIDSSNPSVLYAGFNKNCFKSVDGGVNWTTSSGMYGMCEVILASSNRVFYGSAAGIYKSEDGGISWKESHSGIKATLIPALAVAPSSPNIIYAGAEGNGFFRSVDSGKFWQRMPDFNNSEYVKRIAVESTNANILYLISGFSGDNNFYKSVDGGLTWVKKLSGYLEDLALNKKNPSDLFIVGRTQSGSNLVMALFKSADGGESWTTYKVTSAYSYGYALAIDPTNDAIIYVGGSKLFKTLDGALSWKEITGSIGLEIHSLAVDPVSPKTIYAGTLAGVYRCDNGGLAWKETPSDFDARWIKIDPASTKTIYAGGLEGIYCSQDKGSTWQALNNGLIIDFAFCFDMNMASKILYAGTSGGGVFKKKL